MAISQAIRLKAMELASGTGSLEEISGHIIRFVRDDILYYLDEWDTRAEDVLNKKRGMCAGKARLATELHHAIGIPARFKVIKILGEEGLFDLVMRHLERMAHSESTVGKSEAILRSIQSLPLQRDHIIVQVFLNDRWIDLDISRDSDMDYGMRLMGIWRERKVLSEEGPYDSLDSWLEERMRHRAVTRKRQTFFHVINHQIEQVRRVGRIGKKAGVQAWTDDDVRRSFQEWEVIPDCPACTSMAGEVCFDELAKTSSTALSRVLEPATRRQREEELIDWLYASVRRNIKRGRFWEPPKMLTQRQADCLGYSRILSFLVSDFGLNTGVIEVVQDNSGRYVPHYVCLVKLADGHKRLVDPWYGSPNVYHRLMVARVVEAGKLAVKQLSMGALESAPEVYGLSTEQLTGLSFYILGNSYLNRDMETEAVECYDISLWLYPTNPKTLFNRATALERLHKAKQAQTDYQRAFSIDYSLMRILATIEEIEMLTKLDEKGISESEQRVYLLRKGFITGRKEKWAEIARSCGTTSGEAQAKFSSVLTKLTA